MQFSWQQERSRVGPFDVNAVKARARSKPSGKRSHSRAICAVLKEGECKWVKWHGLTLVQPAGRVGGRSLDEVELRQLHVRGDVDAAAGRPLVGDVLARVSD